MIVLLHLLPIPFCYLCHCQGMLGITLVNVLPAIKPGRDAPPPAGLPVTQAVFWVFMYLTALGSGGIKPCVSTFGGDQFREGSVTERYGRQLAWLHTGLQDCLCC